MGNATGVVVVHKVIQRAENNKYNHRAGGDVGYKFSPVTDKMDFVCFDNWGAPLLPLIGGQHQQPTSSH